MSRTPANPLFDLHRQAEAEFQSYAETEIVSTFGEPQAEYAAVHKSAGLMDLPQRGFIELTGDDRLSFLNGLITAETWDKRSMQGIPAGRWKYSFLLNLKGRIVADMNVLELEDRTLIEIDRRLSQPLVDLFEAYHFSEKVKMQDRVDLHQIALHGRQAMDVLPIAIETESCASMRILGKPAVVWRDDVTGHPGIHILLEFEPARQLWMQLIREHGQAAEIGRRQLRPIGWAAFNAARIEAGRPIFGIDFDGAPIESAYPSKRAREQPVLDASAPGILPAETGQLSRAVSLAKCYLGQEIVARMHARGQIAKLLVGIRMDDPALPIAGAQIFDESSNPIGVITSSTISPVLSNAPICLGYVKRPMYSIGTKLHIAAEGSMHQATVVELPFVPRSE